MDDSVSDAVRVAIKLCLAVVFKYFTSIFVFSIDLCGSVQCIRHRKTSSRNLTILSIVRSIFHEKFVNGSILIFVNILVIINMVKSSEFWLILKYFLSFSRFRITTFYGLQKKLSTRHCRPNGPNISIRVIECTFTEKIIL